MNKVLRELLQPHAQHHTHLILQSMSHRALKGRLAVHRPRPRTRTRTRSRTTTFAAVAAVAAAAASHTT